MAQRRRADRNLIVVLGDQLSEAGAALRAARRDSDVVLMAEVMAEATYVPHHPKKIAFVLSAMRHFAARLSAAGWEVRYTLLDDPENTGSLPEEIARAVAELAPRRVVVTEPGEWRLHQAFADLAGRLDIPLEILPDDRFLCSHDAFAAWADGRKTLRMEHFYRMMRRRTGLLMNGDEPEGGRWNLDPENRQSPPPDLVVPERPTFPPDDTTAAVLDLVEARFSDHFGTLRPFALPVTQDDAGAALDHFLADALPRFGDYQDAMVSGAPFLFHSVLSPALNVGLLEPLAVCRAVEAAWRAGKAPLNAAEGFIRQVIGWREFVRGIYWRFMPDYADLNALGHTRPLPGFYWTGETRMACLAATIGQTRDEAYAHHIQRLMVTGNFAMLAGVEPKQVHEWYLAVYADAYEWVELPNTLGMSQFADGGLLASKPYAAGGNYIRRMSDYCAGCAYDVKVRTGPSACPFNYLYWDFLARHRDRLDGNPRLGPVYRTWDRMDTARQDALRDSARRFLAGWPSPDKEGNWGE